MFAQGADCFAGWGHHFMGGSIFGSLLSILLLLVVVAVIYKVFFSKKFKAGSKNRDAEDSLMILDSRLAKGEITEEEYHRIRKILSGS